MARRARYSLADIPVPADPVRVEQPSLAGIPVPENGGAPKPRQEAIVKTPIEAPDLSVRTQHVRIGMKGIVTDVEPDLLQAHALDMRNVTVSADGSCVVAPAGGRHQTHELAGANPTRLNYHVSVLKCDPTLMGRTTGSFFACLDDTDEVIDLTYFNPDEQYNDPRPLPDIQGPRITITNPSDGDILKTKDALTAADPDNDPITCVENGDTPPGATNLKYELYDEDDEMVLEIVASTPNRLYDWTIPKVDDNGDDLDGVYKMRVEAVDNEWYYAEVENITIEPTELIVLGPTATNPISQFEEGTDLNVIWWSDPNVGATVNIELWKDNAGSPAKIDDISVGESNTPGDVNVMAAPWTITSIPPLVAGNDYFIRITDAGDSDITVDGGEFGLIDSAGNPTIAPALRLRRPSDPRVTIIGTYSGNYTVGDPLAGVVTIAWTSAGDLQGNVIVEITDAAARGQDQYGAVRYTVGTFDPTSVSSTTWNAALPDGHDVKLYKALVRPVSGVVDPSASEYNFRVQSSTPAGGPFQYSGPTGSVQNIGDIDISWQPSGLPGNVRITLVDADGVTWIDNLSTSAGDGSYNYTIPATIALGVATVTIGYGTQTVTGTFNIEQTIGFPNNAPANFVVWNRQDAASLMGHEIWKANVRYGANDTPFKFITWAQTAGIEDASGYDAANGGTTMPTIRQMIHDKDRNILVGWMDADDNGVRRPTQSTGSGLNDIASGGTYSGTAPATFQVKITTAAATDQVAWQKDGGGYGAAVNITGAAQAMSDGVTFTFGATTGHTKDDVFTIEAINSFPLTRVGDTARLKKYDQITSNELWAADCASAIRTLEAGKNAHIYEHMAITYDKDRNVFVALAGYTDTGGGAPYDRRLWVQRIDGSDGTIDETVGYSTTDQAITNPNQVGLCEVYGVCWSPDEHFWVAYSHKETEDGTVAYDPEEFNGRIMRLADDDLTDETIFDPEPEAATWWMPLGIEYQRGGTLLVPVFYEFDPAGVAERRIGLMQMSMNGGVIDTQAFGYPTSDEIYEAYPHPGGGCGFEGNGYSVSTYEASEQAARRSGGMLRPDAIWLSDGRYQHYFDLHAKKSRSRRIDAGGSVGSGTNHTYNCHAMTRLFSGDVAYLSYEYQDSTFADPSNMYARIPICEPVSCAKKTALLSSHVSGNSDEPYLPQPFVWYGGVDSNGNNTEFAKDDLPWAFLSISTMARPEDLEGS